jgi:hypothetical protein
VTIVSEVADHQVGTDGALMSLERFRSNAATRITRSLSVPRFKFRGFHGDFFIKDLGMDQNPGT